MKNQQNLNSKVIITGLVLALIISLLGNLFLFSTPNLNEEEIQKGSKTEPIYWVAPMDANYKRDEPGKSPMGMDLVPVYEEGVSTIDEGSGTIRVSADVINNLGVRTVLAQYKLLHNKIETVGYVTYDEDKLVHIHPRVDGWIDKLYVKTIGSTVKKGQALYDIYSPELVNAQEEFLLALERNNKRLINAAENRLIALQLPSSTISTLKTSRKVQQSITFFAPQNGVVENLNIREGFFVQPGATLMSIGDLSQVWVEAEVFERQAAQVRVGTKVTMRLDYLPGKIFNGQVDFIYPTLDTVTRTVKVRLRFENQRGDFKPNMFAQVTIDTSVDKSALTIPKEALIRTGTQDRVVLALGDGHFKSVEVSVGRFDNTSVEILSGLTEGEFVVSSAQFLLDSESSKSSDFKRMHHDDAVQHQNDAEVMSATTSGVINALMLNHRMATIARAGIEKWQRPPATMDFFFDESLNLNPLKSGDNIHFTFEIRGDEFVIVAFELQLKEQG